MHLNWLNIEKSTSCINQISSFLSTNSLSVLCHASPGERSMCRQDASVSAPGRKINEAKSRHRGIGGATLVTS